MDEDEDARRLAEAAVRWCYCLCRSRHPDTAGDCAGVSSSGMEVHVPLSNTITAKVPMCTPCVEACIAALDAPGGPVRE